jgi:predicted GNAT family acetyltransferase
MTQNDTSDRDAHQEDLPPGDIDLDVEPRLSEDLDAECFELHCGDVLAGKLEYEHHDGKLVATHTEVDGRFRGKGFAEMLVRGLLDSARSQGRVVVPRCTYVEKYLAEHPEYADVAGTE